MALSNEDKKDVAGAFGEKAASAVSKATRDWNSSSSPDIRAKEKSQWRNIKKSDAYKAAKKSPSYKSQALKSKTSNYADESPKTRYGKERSMTRAYEKATGKSVPHSETAKHYNH